MRSMSFAKSDAQHNSYRSIIIACTLRSGSNLLCEILELYGFGKPTEFFQYERYRNPESTRKVSNQKTKTLLDLYEEFLKRHKGSKWRGVKWNWQQFEVLNRALLQDPDLPMEVWLPAPCWIRLRRRDRIGQSVSMYLAKKTGIWVAGDVGILSEREINYSFDEILLEFNELCAEDELWDYHIRTNNLPYIEVFFEDLIKNYNETMHEIINFIEPSSESSKKIEESLPIHLNNAPLGSPLQQTFKERFAMDLVRRRHVPPRLGFDLDKLSAFISNHKATSVMTQFIGDEVQPTTIRKLDLRAEMSVEGEYEWVDGQHFLDKFALRLDPGAKASLSIKAKRVFVEFLSHPWSGIATVSIGGRTDRLDLFGLVSSRYPWMASFEAANDLVLQVLALQEKAELSEGYEVWIQRIWVLSA